MSITMKDMFSIRMPIMGPSKWDDIDVTPTGQGYVYGIFFYRDVTPTGLVSFPETSFYKDVTPTGLVSFP